MKKIYTHLIAAIAFAWCFLVYYVSGGAFVVSKDLGLLFIISPLVAAIGFCLGKIIELEVEL